MQRARRLRAVRGSSHSGNGAERGPLAEMRSQCVTWLRNSGSRSKTSRICARLVRAGNRTSVLKKSDDMEHPFGRQECRNPPEYDAAMPSEVLLIGIATLGVTLTGFAGVV